MTEKTEKDLMDMAEQALASFGGALTDDMKFVMRMEACRLLMRCPNMVYLTDRLNPEDTNEWEGLLLFSGYSSFAVTVNDGFSPLFAMRMSVTDKAFSMTTMPFFPDFAVPAECRDRCYEIIYVDAKTLEIKRNRVWSIHVPDNRRAQVEHAMAVANDSMASASGSGGVLLWNDGKPLVRVAVQDYAMESDTNLPEVFTSMLEDTLNCLAVGGRLVLEAALRDNLDVDGMVQAMFTPSTAPIARAVKACDYLPDNAREIIVNRAANPTDITCDEVFHKAVLDSIEYWHGVRLSRERIPMEPSAEELGQAVERMLEGTDWDMKNYKGSDKLKDDMQTKARTAAKEGHTFMFVCKQQEQPTENNND